MEAGKAVLTGARRNLPGEADGFARGAVKGGGRRGGGSFSEARRPAVREEIPLGLGNLRLKRRTLFRAAGVWRFGEAGAFCGSRNGRLGRRALLRHVEAAVRGRTTFVNGGDEPYWEAGAFRDAETGRLGRRDFLSGIKLPSGEWKTFGRAGCCPKKDRRLFSGLKIAV